MRPSTVKRPRSEQNPEDTWDPCAREAGGTTPAAEDDAATAALQGGTVPRKQGSSKHERSRTARAMEPVHAERGQSAAVWGTDEEPAGWQTEGRHPCGHIGALRAGPGTSPMGPRCFPGRKRRP